MDKKSMQILVITQDAQGADWEGKDEVLREEARHVWDLQQRGVIRNIWFTDPGRDAVILMECESIQAARKILDDFPLVRHGLIVCTATALKAYDGYERLFGKQGLR